MVRHGVIVVCLLNASWLLAGCEDHLGDACDGRDNAVSCLSVVGLAPMDIDGTTTDEVDAFRDTCATDAVGNDILEPFDTHAVEITFRNDILPVESDSGSSLIIERFTVSYELLKQLLSSIDHNDEKNEVAFILTPHIVPLDYARLRQRLLLPPGATPKDTSESPPTNR
jgi:hypothetical protein